MRKLFFLALLAIILLAVSVYRAKLGASQAEAAIADLEVEVEALREELVVLRSELTHLSRDERIDRIAREELDMGPIKPEQVVSAGELAERLSAARASAAETVGEVAQ